MSKVIQLTKPDAGAPRKQVGWITAKANGGRGEIYVYGIIGSDWYGDGVTANQFAEALKKLGKVDTIDLRINSDGGLVTDARAMYTLLVENKAKVITHIDGIAASAASFLAMAGDEIEIGEGSYVMIHNARMGMHGEAEDFDRAAAILRTVGASIIETYAARTGNTPEQLKKWMDAETWFTGKEAMEAGFADRIVENKTKAAASLMAPYAYKKLPAALRPRRMAALAAIAGMSAK